MTHSSQPATRFRRTGRPGARRTPVLLVGLALCAGLYTACPAVAQTYEAEEESVGRRPRLDFESYGLSLDALDRGAKVTGTSPVYSFSRLEVEAGHDSNVRRTASGETASLFTVTRPGVSLNVDGETHQSMLVGQAAIGRYGSSGGDDYEDLELNLVSRVELDEDADLVVNASAARNHIDRGSDLDLGSSFGTQTYGSYTAGAQLQSLAFADNPLSAAVQSTWYRFDDVDGVDRSGLDRWIGAGNARIGFARTGEVSYFVQPGVQRVNYTEDSSGNVDSTRLDLAVGATYSGGAVSQFTGFAGLSRRSFEDSGLSAEYSALIGANALWNATELMTLRGELSISNEDSELSAASSVTTTEFSLGLDYEAWDNLVAGTEIRWTDNRYSGDVADERLLEAGVGLRYLLNEYAYLGAGLRWEDQTSDDPSEEFRATVASLRLGIKLCCLRDVEVEEPGGRSLRQGVINRVFR